MRFISEAAKKYAGSLFDVTGTSEKRNSILNEMRELRSVFAQKELVQFLNSPLLSEDQRLEVVDQTFATSKLQPELLNLIKVVVEKQRAALFEEILFSFQEMIDEENGVVRGLVRSASTLGPDQRESIEKKVNEATGRKVILEYGEDAELIGGLVAEVGSLTFDDTLKTQLRLMKENLNRSAF